MLVIIFSDGGVGVIGDVEVYFGLWLFEIEGCDYLVGNIFEECKVFVIVEIGFYYSDGDVDALILVDRLGWFFIENFVFYGYGVVQVLVFGIGEFNYCMDLMGYDEMEGIKVVVDWLG